MARVLLVEDDRSIRLLISRVLDKAGHHVVEAGDGQIALALLHVLPQIDIILSDIRMPFMDGLELLEIVKSEYPKLPVLMLTAYLDNAIDALEQGAVQYIQKPFNPHMLVQLVHDTLGLQN